MPATGFSVGGARVSVSEGGFMVGNYFLSQRTRRRCGTMIPPTLRVLSGFTHGVTEDLVCCQEEKWSETATPRSGACVSQRAFR